MDFHNPAASWNLRAVHEWKTLIATVMERIGIIRYGTLEGGPCWVRTSTYEHSLQREGDAFSTSGCDNDLPKSDSMEPYHDRSTRTRSHELYKLETSLKFAAKRRSHGTTSEK